MSEQRPRAGFSLGIGTLLLVVAAGIFLLGAFGVELGKVNMLLTGLFFLTLGLLL